MTVTLAASATHCCAQTQSYQRLGTTSDMGSWYKYYNSPPSGRQLDQGRVLLENERQRLNAEWQAREQEIKSFNEQQAAGKRYWDKWEQDRVALNKKQEELRASIADINRRSNILTAEINEFNDAKSSPTSEEFLQRRIGVIDARSSVYKYYDENGKRSVTKSNSVAENLWDKRRKIDAEYSVTDFFKDGIKKDAAKRDARWEELSQWDVQMKAFRKRLDEKGADYKERQADYSRRVNAYDEEIASYNRRIDRKNSSGSSSSAYRGSSGSSSGGSSDEDYPGMPPGWRPRVVIPR